MVSPGWHHTLHRQHHDQQQQPQAQQVASQQHSRLLLLRLAGVWGLSDCMLHSQCHNWYLLLDCCSLLTV
jgi:hypothetical protein